jgi:hypothetical protein
VMKSVVRMAFALRVVAAFVLLGIPGQAIALQTFVSEEACRLHEYPRPLRQTLVVIDQSVFEKSGMSDSNEAGRWINRTIVTLAGVQEGQAGIISAPRERLTLLLALRDGSDLVRLFTGCPPTYSQTEMSDMEKSETGFGGQLRRFIGRDLISRIEKEKQAFRTALLGSLVQVTKPGALKSGIGTEEGSLDSSFLRSLSLAGGAFDIAEGVPRLIVISPLKPRPLEGFPTVKAAREAGFDLAARLSADLQRAEVYVIGSQNSGKYLRDFGNAFFLGMKGRLISIGGEILPKLDEPPQTVQVFGGFIDYGGVKAPMQLRLAIDRGGSLVNSWVEVALERPVATPLTGKAVCKPEKLDSCQVKGDGKEFAQSWVVDMGPAPKFDPSLPFSGLRYFEFESSTGGLKGRVYDPIAVLNNPQKDLPFELSRTSGVKF